MAQQHPHTPKLLTMTEYASIMGLSPSKVKRLKLAGRIPYLQEGQTVRIPIEATNYEWLTNWQLQHAPRP